MWGWMAYRKILCLCLPVWYVLLTNKTKPLVVAAVNSSGSRGSSSSISCNSSGSKQLVSGSR